MAEVLLGAVLGFLTLTECPSNIGYNCLSLLRGNLIDSLIFLTPLPACYIPLNLDLSGKYKKVSFSFTVKISFLHQDKDIHYVQTSGVF